MNDGWFRVPLGIGRTIFGSRYYGSCTGFRVINGKTWRYRYENEGPDPKKMFIKAMTRGERLREWWRRTLFGVCVGWHHHHDKNGMWVPAWQFGTRATRRPAWLAARLYHGYFYGWRGLLIPDGPRWTKRINRIYSENKAKP